MKKTIYITVATLALALVVSLVIPMFTALPHSPVMVTVDGQRVHFQGQDPVIIHDRVLVPVRGVFEEMGFEVYWHSYSRTAWLTSDQHTIIIPEDTGYFVVNGEFIIPEVPQRIINDRLMMPLRAVAEAVDATATWNGSQRIAAILSAYVESSPAPTTPPFVTPPPLPPGEYPPSLSTPALPQPPPNPPVTINDYFFWNMATDYSVFDVEFFRVEGGEIVSSILPTYGNMNSAFTIWAELNNIHVAALLDSSMFMTWEIMILMCGQVSGGGHRTVMLNVSPETLYYMEGEHGMLLMESLANTFKGMWRPVSGYIRFNLFASPDADTLSLALATEGAVFSSSATKWCYCDICRD